MQLLVDGVVEGVAHGRTLRDLIHHVDSGLSVHAFAIVVGMEVLVVARQDAFVLNLLGELHLFLNESVLLLVHLGTVVNAFDQDHGLVGREVHVHVGVAFIALVLLVSVKRLLHLLDVHGWTVVLAVCGEGFVVSSDLLLGLATKRARSTDTWEIQRLGSKAEVDPSLAHALDAALLLRLVHANFL